ncbi:MAG: hypothetical protein Q8M88_16595, partial [Phenylobacterium sp.]|uniref:hypothetical protein n=1 Tax=Phenylobacterium sp. TaxID=1871053 RepID=UPI002736E259
KYNHAIFGPESAGRPIFQIGFQAPPTSTTVSIWEDPWYLYGVEKARDCCLMTWSPIGSRAEFIHQINLTKQAVGLWISLLGAYSIFAWAIIVSAAAVLFVPHGTSSSDRFHLAMILGTMAAYMSGYALLWVDDRYVWPMLPLTLILGLYLLNRLDGLRPALFQQAPRLGQAWLLTLTILFAASFLFKPAYELENRRGAALTTNGFVTQLRGGDLQGARLATNTDYGAAVIIAYHLKAKYYGQTPVTMTDAQAVPDMRRQGVQYFLAFDKPPVPISGLELVNFIRSGARTLAIYAVPQASAPAR